VFIETVGESIAEILKAGNSVGKPVLNSRESWRANGSNLMELRVCLDTNLFISVKNWERGHDFCEVILNQDEGGAFEVLPLLLSFQSF